VPEVATGTLERGAPPGDRLDEVVLADAHERAEVVAERAVELVDRGVEDRVALGHRRQARAQRVGERELAGALAQAVGLCTSRLRPRRGRVGARRRAVTQGLGRGLLGKP